MTFAEVINLVGRYLHNRSDLISVPALAEGTNSATIKTGKDITFYLWGTRYTKTATDNIAMTACTQQAISTYCLYLVTVDSAGTVTVTKGTSVATDTAALPTTPAGQVAIGAFKVQTSGAVTFTSGTTDLSAAGLTVTYYDFDTALVAQAIRQAIWRLEHQYNFRCMKVRTTATLATSTHTVNNPITNYKKLLAAFAQDSNGVNIPIRRTSYLDAITKYPDLTDDIGTPEMFCEVPTSETSLTPDAAPTHQLLIRPTTTASESYTLNFLGYQYTPELDGAVYTTNWWTQNASNVLLYGALLELQSYLIKDERLPVWQQFYLDAVTLLKNTEIEEETSGSYQNIESDYVV